MSDTLPLEITEFLVRTLPSRALWIWLGETEREELRTRVTRGFRATAEVLRQPVARSRLASHLQHSEDDWQSLLQLWGKDTPKILEAVRAVENDAALIAQLPILQAFHGAEALTLALLLEERDAVLEVWADSEETPPDPAAPDGETQVGSTPSAKEVALEKQLQRAQNKVEAWRAKAHDAKSNAAQTEKTLREKLREHETLARAASREARQAHLKAEAISEKLEAAEKARERAERKARSIVGELEESQSEAKTLRRQIRQLQQINEELRRRLKAAGSTPAPGAVVSETLSESKPKTKNSPPASPSGVLSAPAPRAASAEKRVSGLQISLSELQRAIDRNDEISVAQTIAALENLREKNAAEASRAVKMIRGLGRYYERVLCHPTTRVLVDASNVARHDGPGKGRLSYLDAMQNELRRFDFFPILFIADASLPYHVDEADEFRNRVKRGEIFVSASGQEADEILAREARETGAYVVTNDRNFHRHLAPNFTPLRIGFEIVDGVAMLKEF
jgi:flagellar biosynthesis GTPase FlhF